MPHGHAPRPPGGNGERVLARPGRIGVATMAVLAAVLFLLTLAFATESPAEALLPVGALAALPITLGIAIVTSRVTGREDGVLIIRNVVTEIHVTATSIEEVEVWRGFLGIHLRDGRVLVPGIFDVRSDLMAGTSRFVRARESIDAWRGELVVDRVAPPGDKVMVRRLRRYWLTWSFVAAGAVYAIFVLAWLLFH